MLTNKIFIFYWNRDFSHCATLRLKLMPISLVCIKENLALCFLSISLPLLLKKIMVLTQWIHCPWRKNENSPNMKFFWSLAASYKQGGRLVGARGAGGAMAPTAIDRSVNPISNRGAYYAQHITTRPPDFQTFRHHCIIITMECFVRYHQDIVSLKYQ